MIELLELFSTQEWAIRALIASSLVGMMCGALGVFIVLRNMALIGDALSHAILPGVFVAFLIAGYSTLAFFVGSVVAGLLTAILITWIQQNINTKNDAAIGIVFTAMFSIGVMGISWLNNSQGVHLDLKDFLVGNVLGVSDEDIWLTLGVAVYVLLSITFFYRYLFATSFQEVVAETMGIPAKMIHYFLMLMLAFAVVASLRTAGIILVVAMLITPASAALLLSDRLKTVIFFASGIGLLSAIIGLIVSIKINTTPAPAMAVVATLFYLTAALFSPKRGLVFNYIRRQNLKKKIRFEDCLKQSLKLHEREIPIDINALAERLGYSKQYIPAQIAKMRQKNYLFPEGKNTYRLSPEGVSAGNKLVRAHRLWETFLVNKLGHTAEQIHEDAKKYEHLLTDELLDEVDAELGFPKTDPHGSPIPDRN